MFIIITLFVQLYVRVGILYVHYNNAVRPVIKLVLVFYMFIIISLFVLLYVRVGILYVHYNNAVRPVICDGWYFICSL